MTAAADGEYLGPIATFRLKHSFENAMAYKYKVYLTACYAMLYADVCDWRKTSYFVLCGGSMREQRDICGCEYAVLTHLIRGFY